MVEEDPADGGAVPAVEPPPPLAADDGAEGFGVVRVGEAVALHGQADSDELEGGGEGEGGDAGAGPAEEEAEALGGGAVVVVEPVPQVVEH